MAPLSLVTFCLLSCFTSLAFAKQEIVVYFPSTFNADFITEKISQRCADFDVKTFDRSDELRRYIKRHVIAENHENQVSLAMLSMPVVVQSFSQFAKAVQGSRKGAANEKNVLLSLPTGVAQERGNQFRIGVIDLLGHRKTQAYVTSLIGKKTEIARASKLDDLTSLLVLKMADALFVSERIADIIRSRSPLALTVTPVDGESGIAMAGILQNAPASAKQSLYACLQSFDNHLNAIFGVDAWKLLE